VSLAAALMAIWVGNLTLFAILATAWGLTDALWFVARPGLGFLFGVLLLGLLLQGLVLKWRR